MDMEYNRPLLLLMLAMVMMVLVTLAISMRVRYVNSSNKLVTTSYGSRHFSFDNFSLLSFGPGPVIGWTIVSRQ